MLSCLNGPLWPRRGLTHVAWARLVRLAFLPGHSSWQLPGNPPTEAPTAQQTRGPFSGRENWTPQASAWKAGEEAVLQPTEAPLPTSITEGAL